MSCYNKPMPKIASYTSLGFISLSRENGKPLHRQLYEALRREILRGQLRPGTRLPPTRALAKEMGVARNTISNAYKQLLAEGYLESKVGSGTRVTQRLPERILQVEGGSKVFGQQTAVGEPDNRKPRLSERGTAVSQLPYQWEKIQPRAFTSTMPGVDAFPFKLWEKMLVTSWRSLSSNQLGYQSAMGYRPLREAIASYLQTARGVRCTTDQVIITNGTQQALNTITQLLLNKGDEAWVENPSYNGIKAALRGTLAKMIPISVDNEGLVVQEGLKKSPKARLAFISPSHQYPLGVTMSLMRRIELLQWAQEERVWVIEDDYDSEFRYEGYPLSALQGLDTAGRVIYVGTFSKVLFPALRIGYMVVPSKLVKPFHAARAHMDRGVTLLEQVVLTTFINEGHFARHIRRMRLLYEERQEIFVQAAGNYLAGLLNVETSAAGLHVVGWLPDGAKDHLVSEALLAHGIDAPPVSAFALEPIERQGLVIGYGAVGEEAILTAVKKMRRILGKQLRSTQ